MRVACINLSSTNVYSWCIRVRSSSLSSIICWVDGLSTTSVPGNIGWKGSRATVTKGWSSGSVSKTRPRASVVYTGGSDTHSSSVSVSETAYVRSTSSISLSLSLSSPYGFFTNLNILLILLHIFRYSPSGNESTFASIVSISCLRSSILIVTYFKFYFHRLRYLVGVVRSTPPLLGIISQAWWLLWLLRLRWNSGS